MKNDKLNTAIDQLLVELHRIIKRKQINPLISQELVVRVNEAIGIFEKLRKNKNKNIPEKSLGLLGSIQNILDVDGKGSIPNLFDVYTQVNKNK